MAMPIAMPDLGVSHAAVSHWFAEPGDFVHEGDRLVEILAGPATFDVSAPATGRLTQRLALLDDPVFPGDVLGFLEPESDS